MATLERTFKDSGSGTHRLLAMAFFLFCTSAVAVLGSFATRGGRNWYEGLEKPVFNPPDWVFGAVWTPLYVLMAVAAWLVYRNRRPGWEVALAAWGVQLALNLAWSWVFFGAEQPGWGLVEIGGLIAAVAVTTVLFWRQNVAAGALLTPYLAWVCFAAALNFEIWRLN